ncbi:hypothetical protein INR49_026160 [Caranx melampygus]|nr:hypothetical protein INR49_026160 [Caranx melampygus]
MDGAGETSRCAVATKLNTPLMNALIWLPACRTSGGTDGYQELIQARCNPPCRISGENKCEFKGKPAGAAQQRACSELGRV